jgi:CRP-like cAMP-binding protein
VIRTAEVFRGAQATTLADLDFLLKSRGFREGQEVPGPAEGEGLFGLVVGGAFKVQRWLSCDQYVVTEVLGPGEVFFWGDSDRADTGLKGYPTVLVSLTTSCLLAMNLAEIWPLVARDPVLAPRLLDHLGQRLGRLADRFARFLVFPAEHRLAFLLGLLVKIKGRSQAGCPGLVPFNLTRKDLAAMAGLTLETASRVLSQWEREGWVRSGRGWVEVRDTQALERLCLSEEDHP